MSHLLVWLVRESFSVFIMLAILVLYPSGVLFSSFSCAGLAITARRVGPTRAGESLFDFLHFPFLYCWFFMEMSKIKIKLFGIKKFPSDDDFCWAFKNVFFSSRWYFVGLLRTNLKDFPQERLKEIKSKYGKVSLGDTTVDMVCH